MFPEPILPFIVPEESSAIGITENRDFMTAILGRQTYNYLNNRVLYQLCSLFTETGCTNNIFLLLPRLWVCGSYYTYVTAYCAKDKYSTKTSRPLLSSFKNSLTHLEKQSSKEFIVFISVHKPNITGSKKVFHFLLRNLWKIKDWESHFQSELQGYFQCDCFMQNLEILLEVISKLVNYYDE